MSKHPMTSLWTRSRALSAGLLLGALTAGSVALSAPGKTARTPASSPDAGAAGGKSSDSASVVRVLIQTVPPRKAQVRWGRKRLGIIPAPRPLVIERPRDSGPMDLVIRASGYLPVHTRAYTFSDSRVVVKLTAPEDKSSLFGYRLEPVVNPDGGAPAATPPAAPPTTAPGVSPQPVPPPAGVPVGPPPPAPQGP
jgi:hypothetical protein